MESGSSQQNKNLKDEVAEMKSQMVEMTKASQTLKTQMEEMMRMFSEVIKNNDKEKGTNDASQGLQSNAMTEPPIFQETITACMTSTYPTSSQVQVSLPMGTTMPTSEMPVIHDPYAYQYPYMEQPPIMTLSKGTDIEKEKDKLQDELLEKLELSLREKMRIYQGVNTYGGIDLDHICQAPDISIPKDFKLPEFAKYSGKEKPDLHLKSYFKAMAIWSKEEKFLIHFFHESLTGAALQWFMQLDHSKFTSFKDLAMEFMNHYRFNMDIAPTRDQVKGMKKKENETFREYAQRWRELAAQVQPPLTNAEMCSYFLRTLGDPYFRLMIGTNTQNFTDLIETGERIEASMADGLLVVETNQNKKNPIQKKKEGELNAVQATQKPFQARNPPYYPPYQAPSPNMFPRPNTIPGLANNTPISPQANQTSHQINYIPPPRPYSPIRPYPRQPYPYQTLSSQFAQNYSRPPRIEPPYPDFGMSNAELYKQLLEARLIAPTPMRPVEPPYPRWYNPNLTCEFHMGAIGHSIEDCRSFKNLVMLLLERKDITIQDANRPNVTTNPLPNHGNTSNVNAIEMDREDIGIIADIKMPMKILYEHLKKNGYGHTLSPKEYDEKEAQDEDATCEFHQGQKGHYIEDCQDFKYYVQQLMTFGILCFEKILEGGCREINVLQNEWVKRKPVVIIKSTSLPMQTEKNPLIVIQKPTPFPYESNHAVPWSYKGDVVIENKTPICKTSTVTNVVGTGGFTRSGRCYRSTEAEKIENIKVKEYEKEEKDAVEEKDDEFLKIMKQSEYDVVEQLRKTPAKISLLSLILSSPVHRCTLQKILEEAYVRPDIPLERFENVVNSIKASNTITFSEDEVRPCHIKQPKALHITLKCHDHIIAKVLIDNGSSLNVLPYDTLLQLQVDPKNVHPCDMIVRAFDGTRREIMGNISLPLIIGPSHFEVSFQVMDIQPAYTMLLGRPWIHLAGAVPSTLHQCLKYIEKGHLITIKGEEDIMVTSPGTLPYIENAEEALESSFQSLEIVEGQPNQKIGKNVNDVVTRMMMKNGFQPGKGLGVRLQGINHPITLPKNPKHQGLGYDVKTERLPPQTCETHGTSDRIPQLQNTFPSHSEVIMVDSFEGQHARGKWVWPTNDEELLDNWDVEQLPEVLSIK